jgi:histidinol phosphatase-like enzyme
LIAYRPLGGERRDRIARDPVMSEIAARHDTTAHEIALAWLRDLDACVVPIPGATRTESAASIGRVLAIELTDADRARLDERFPAGRLLRVPRSARRPAGDAAGAVVIVMGMPAAGKSSVAAEYTARGYERLNRDSRGGSFTDLTVALDAGLGGGRRRWVLDNTYASRRSRNEVIECAWKHGVAVHCVMMDTPIADAQINAIMRLIEANGRLPMPEELRARGRTDHRYFGPDAQFRYERQLEPPEEAEGFASVERRPFDRQQRTGNRRALLFEYDGVLCTSASGSRTALDPTDVEVPEQRRDLLARHHADGWTLLATAWRPGIARNEVSEAVVRACFDRTRELIGVDIDIALCSHDAGPPVCWCRKPIPGLALEFAVRHGLALDQCISIGRSQADQTMAGRLGMRYVDHGDFFAGRVPVDVPAG